MVRESLYNRSFRYTGTSLSFRINFLPLNSLSSQPDLSLTFHSTHSSSAVVSLSQLPTVSSLKITDRAVRYAWHHCWNQLPDSFRQPHQSCHLRSPVQSTSRFISPASPIMSPSFTCSFNCQVINSSSPRSASITSSYIFHFVLKTFLFYNSFPL